MTHDEVRQWAKHHRTCYPGFATWFGKFPSTATRDDDVTKADMVTHWRRQLEPFEFADAIEATDAMVRGDIEEPRGYDRHLTAVITFCRLKQRARKRDERPAFLDGEQLITCQICQDQGRVIVWSLKSMRAARDGNLGSRGTLYSSAVACTCETGDDFARSMIRYNENIMRIAPFGPDRMADEEFQRDLIEFVEGLTIQKPHNEFEEFA